ncbi:MAG TPA: ATP-grasp domain-containing protein [Pseudomonadota bacterium]|nr:ATP-grasp domain-containing protein [Pseudomonadota bacterium]
MSPHLPATAKPKILVVCPTDWEKDELRKPTVQAAFDFHICGEDLYEFITLEHAQAFEVRSYLMGIVDSYRSHGVSGVLGTGDYPGCMFSAFIAEQLGLPGPTPREVVLLSHKYYSRLKQRDLVPEATPHFELVDSFRPDRPKHLDFPFFVKPVKGTMSIRAQMVNSQEALERAVALTPEELLRYGAVLHAYSQLLAHYEPDPIPIHYFIAEAPLRGVQVTVDGFVQSGVSTVMGITDSIMYPGTISFERFEYPSSLPDGVQAKMVQIANRLMSAVGFDHSCYNIEMFYDPVQDAISIIEINPRMSYQFADLFERVDGMSSFAVQLALATGKQVHWPRGQGPCKVAASFVMRRFSDAQVISVPSAAALALLQERFPGTHVELLCAAGERLSDHDQDVGSFRYCIVNMAAQSKSELYDHYAELQQILRFEFA